MMARALETETCQHQLQNSRDVGEYPKQKKEKEVDINDLKGVEIT